MENETEITNDINNEEHISNEKHNPVDTIYDKKKNRDNPLVFI